MVSLVHWQIQTSDPTVLLYKQHNDTYMLTESHDLHKQLFTQTWRRTDNDQREHYNVSI